MKAIACVDKNMGLGLNGELLIHSKKDMTYFKRMTLNHYVIMGRKTFENIGSPLTKRTNIVLSSRKIQNNDVITFSSVLDFLSSEYKHKDTFVIGGASVYKQLLPYIDEIYLTEVDADLKADVFFPEFKDKFTLVEKQLVKDGDLVMEFCKYDRVSYGNAS